MTRYLTTAALAAILGVVGCSTAPTPQITYALVPVKSNGQDLPGLDTKTTLESRQPGGIVSIRGDEQFAAFGAGFIVAVQNKSGAPVDFGPKNISASVNGKPVTVLAAEELDQRVKVWMAKALLPMATPATAARPAHHDRTRDFFTIYLLETG
jgi:hypothetical protein